jgi:hypothetical protein
VFVTTVHPTVFIWDVTQLERRPETGEILIAHYTVNANDGTYKTGVYGSVALGPVDAESMVPFSEVTKAQAIEWVKQLIGGGEKVAEIQAALQAKLDEQRFPRAVGVPW